MRSGPFVCMLEVTKGKGTNMRLSTAYYPETVDYHCASCGLDHYNVKVDSIEDDFVRVECRSSECGEPTYVRVIFD